VKRRSTGRQKADKKNMGVMDRNETEKKEKQTLQDSIMVSSGDALPCVVRKFLVEILSARNV
jgi:hypothetical protein